MDWIKQTAASIQDRRLRNPASALASLFSYPGVDEFKIDQSYAETASLISLMVVIGETGNGMAWSA
jgi:hypothetical protein